MNSNEKKVQDALAKMLTIISEQIGDPNDRALIYGKVKEAQLLHKGLLRDK